MDKLYQGFVVDKKLPGADPHFASGCTSCHKGNDAEFDKEKAHQKLVARPSDDPRTCAACHDKIVSAYTQSLHFTTAGLRNGLIKRLGPDEIKLFDQKVFPQSCRSCYASCGDCHVKSPKLGGLNLGLISGHKFVRRDEAKTCAFCHGGRVYAEFTGEYGSSADAHHQRGMTCVTCHAAAQLRGDGTAPAARQQVKAKPVCGTCHKTGSEEDARARSAHAQHTDRVSCTACHASAAYRNCSGCHLGKGAASQPRFFLGLDQRDNKTLTTLRLVPTVRDTFKPAGIRMERFDALPNYWPTVPHNIRKVTERTRSCESCHQDASGFLKKGDLVENGSKKNEGLISTPKPLTK